MRPLGLAVVALITAAAPEAAPAQPLVVPPLARVVDQAGALRRETREQLTRLLEAHERRSSDQVVVVTLASLGGRDIADVARTLGNAWRLGTREHSNGALLVVAPRERKVRIAVGSGLEKSLPDARARQIIDLDVLPHFRAGNLDAGVVAGTYAILAAIDGTYVAPSRWAILESREAKIGLVVLLAAGGVLLIIVAVSWNYAREQPRGPRRRWFSGRDDDDRDGYRDPSAWTWGGSRSSGGFSGGGGSFGGGGASGSW